MENAIIGWQKASQAYCRMQKRASDSGSGQGALHTVNFALSWLFKQIKEYVTQSPVPAGLIKVPLFIRLLLYIFSKFGRLVLWEIIFILELQFAETQAGVNLTELDRIKK